MSGAISRGPQTGPPAEPLAAPEAGGSRGRGRWVALGIVVVLGAVAGWRAGLFSAAASPGAGPGAPPPATAVVTRQDLTATTPESATLGYAGAYTVRGRGSGTLTWLPPAGQVLRQGQALYKTGDGSPVVLLYGSVPDWRALGVGTTGQDVTQLNHDLANLGYAARADITALTAGITTPGRRRRRCSSWRSTWGWSAPRGACRWGRWCSSRERSGSAR